MNESLFWVGVMGCIIFLYILFRTKIRPFNDEENSEGEEKKDD